MNKKFAFHIASYHSCHDLPKSSTHEIFKVVTTRKGFVHLLPLIAIAIFIALVIIGNSKQPKKVISTPSSVKTQIASLVTNSTTTATNTDKLEKYFIVQAAMLGVTDNISLYFKDLTSLHEVSIDPVRSWIPASTIKAYVILEAFRQKRLGIIDFTDPVTIPAGNIVPTELETDDFPKLREGTTTTIGQLVEAMVEQSDNTAYNTLLDILDRRNINQTLHNLGITETVVGQKLNLDDNQIQLDQETPGYQLNTTTAKDLATFFNILYDKKVPDYQEIISIFEKQKINNMIPAFLPPTTLVAHKTGDWAPIYHDGGIIFKKGDPFILSIFTNSNDPAVIAKLAQVGYFQSAAVIGKAEAKIPPRSYLAQNKTTNKIETYLAQNPQNKILGQNTAQGNFPNITAADLGITIQDLNPQSYVAQNISSAIINPGSIFYNFKKFFENTRLKIAQNNSDKISTTLDISKDRLSEVKSALQKGDIKTATSLITQSENDMKKSIDISQQDKPRDADLLKIKQVNDLHFTTLAQAAASVPAPQKDAFIDMAYDFYTQNQKEIKPIIAKSLAKNSTQQEPIIGTVDKVSGNTLTVRFDDGSTKDVIINDSVPSRKFDSTQPQTSSTVQVGTKIAIVGQTTNSGKIIPTFILKDIPKAFPDKKTGTVTQVDPAKNTLKIQDSSGKTQEVKIGDDTVVKSKDTNVSVEGIKPGSQITVFGASGQNTTTSNTTQSTPAKSASSGSSINANTVTVTKNAPSKSEEKKDQSKPPPPAKSEPAKTDDKSKSNKK